uniref:GATA-type domain-containing protein n=1 Tax=Meloidogyne enterolobii TaxID=390850 RepID=A0A6V7W751_MELEN|nr:unnamed protein product [Meloidogyne enterolobii]
MELLGKQKVKYPKELKSEIKFIGSKISEINEGNRRHCFNCGVKQYKKCYKYLKGKHLCNTCGVYLTTNGKFRPKKMWFRIKKKDRQCYICEATKTSAWYQHLEHGQYLYYCNSCYKRNYAINKIKNKENELN